MDISLQNVKAELNALGFLNGSKEDHVNGRVPLEGNINGIYIEVNIALTDFPFKMPFIILNSINDNKDLYEITPKYWKHLDEIVWDDNPKNTAFSICCLHNWNASSEYNGDFIYSRILDWLKLNCENNWQKEHEVQGWRMTPHFSQSRIYLSENILNKINVKKPIEVPVAHNLYQLKNGTFISGKKEATNYSYDDIDYSKSYDFFPSVKDDLNLIKIEDMKLMGKTVKSNFIFIRLPQSFSFTTYYQLLMSVRRNFDLKQITKGRGNVPFVILYKGFMGELEAISFIADHNFVYGEENFKAKPLSVESLPKRPMSINLRVGLIGVGSLGSQVARILTDKQTKEILLYDKEVLSGDNLGHHELNGVFVNFPKSQGLEMVLNSRSFNSIVKSEGTIEDIYEKSDILVITVGDSEEFDRLAFNELQNYKKPIIWAWTSQYNVLSEVVITTPTTGCLNCYYQLEREEDTLVHFNNLKKSELSGLTPYFYDFCGSPHIISQWERNVFLATQIVSIINYYNKFGNPKFDYFTYFWGVDEIIATPTMGKLNKHKMCNCNRGVL